MRHIFLTFPASTLAIIVARQVGVDSAARGHLPHRKELMPVQDARALHAIERALDDPPFLYNCFHFALHLGKTPMTRKGRDYGIFRILLARVLTGRRSSIFALAGFSVAVKRASCARSKS